MRKVRVGIKKINWGEDVKGKSEKNKKINNFDKIKKHNKKIKDKQNGCLSLHIRSQGK